MRVAWVRQRLATSRQRFGPWRRENTTASRLDRGKSGKRKSSQCVSGRRGGRVCARPVLRDRGGVVGVCVGKLGVVKENLIRGEGK